MRKFFIYFMLCAAVFCSLAFSVFSANEQDAYQKAREVIVPKYQKRVLSIYGRGDPDKVDTWYVKFFDPDSKTKARVVVIEGGAVERNHPSEDASIHNDQLAFDPALTKVHADAALKAAEKYANDNAITYDATRVFLRGPAVGKSPTWTVELVQEGTS